MSTRNRPPKTPLQRFTVSFFVAALLILSFVAGVHAGLLILTQTYQWPAIVTVHVVVFYWLGVAAALTWFARRQIRKNYETPMRLISDAATKVAKGDFSISIPYAHREEQFDAFDHMITDINQMISELRSVETLKTDFISNVSHEMKTPLAIIRNYAELLQSPDITPERQAEYAANVKEAAERMSGLISDILRLNRLENQRITPNPQRYDVCRQLVECALQFEKQLDEKSLELETDMEDCAFIRADKGLLELVWNNLMSNAVKFTEPGGVIGIRERTEENKVIVSFADTGCGIERDSLRHIFDKFYQGDTSHATEGNGLGLALAQGVATLSGGSIQAESEPGKGSVFTVTLPVL